MQKPYLQAAKKLRESLGSGFHVESDSAGDLWISVRVHPGYREPVAYLEPGYYVSEMAGESHTFPNEEDWDAMVEYAARRIPKDVQAHIKYLQEVATTMSKAVKGSEFGD